MSCLTILGVEMQAAEVYAQHTLDIHRPVWMGFNDLKHIVSCHSKLNYSYDAK